MNFKKFAKEYKQRRYEEGTSVIVGIVNIVKVCILHTGPALAKDEPLTGGPPPPPDPPDLALWRQGLYYIYARCGPAGSPPGAARQAARPVRPAGSPRCRPAGSPPGAARPPGRQAV